MVKNEFVRVVAERINESLYVDDIYEHTAKVYDEDSVLLNPQPEITYTISA